LRIGLPFDYPSPPFLLLSLSLAHANKRDNPDKVSSWVSSRRWDNSQHRSTGWILSAISSALIAALISPIWGRARQMP